VGEGLALDAVWLFAAVLALIVLAAAALASRRFLLERGGGTVECGLRSPAGSGTWRLGVASYEGDDLGWYGALGVRFRPEQVFHRRSLRVLSRRPSLPSESSVLGPEHTVVELDSDAGRVELAMTAEALTGFLSWLESSPPGSHLEDIALLGCGRVGLGGVSARSVGPGAAPNNAARHHSQRPVGFPVITKTFGRPGGHGFT
jgi:hypothetical protein